MRIATIGTGKASEDYEAGRLAGLTLADELACRKFAPRLLTDYLAPYPDLSDRQQSSCSLPFTIGTALPANVSR